MNMLIFLPIEFQKKRKNPYYFPIPLHQKNRPKIDMFLFGKSK